MRTKLPLFVTMSCAFALSGCAEYSMLKDRVGEEVARPNTGLLPPTVGPITEVNRKLRDLPPPQRPVAVAVYGYVDQTGQFKPSDNVQTLSRAVTQGATSILIKALQDASNGRWFTVIERERLDNLLKERRIIADMRQRYLGETNVNPGALPPLLFAGVMLDGGIIGYDSNTRTGGAGAKYFGIGGDIKYREDTVTVYLRGVSVKTGQVLLSVVANKTILSYGVDANAFRYVTFNRLFEAEGGFTQNEPGSLAVQQAIEKAVLTFIVEGSARGLWSFGDKAFQAKIIDDYEMNYLTVASANAGTAGTPPANGNGGTALASNTPPAASAPVKPVSARPKPSTAQVRTAAAIGQAKPAQALLVGAPSAGSQAAAAPVQQQRVADATSGSTTVQGKTPVVAAQQPAPKFVVQQPSLEDEAGINPR